MPHLPPLSLRTSKGTWLMGLRCQRNGVLTLKQHALGGESGGAAGGKNQGNVGKLLSLQSTRACLHSHSARDCKGQTLQGCYCTCYSHNGPHALPQSCAILQATQASPKYLCKCRETLETSGGPASWGLPHARPSRRTLLQGHGHNAFKCSLGTPTTTKLGPVSSLGLSPSPTPWCIPLP